MSGKEPAVESVFHRVKVVELALHLQRLGVDESCGPKSPVLCRPRSVCGQRDQARVAVADQSC